MENANGHGGKDMPDYPFVNVSNIKNGNMRNQNNIEIVNKSDRKKGDVNIQTLSLSNQLTKNLP